MRISICFGVLFLVKMRLNQSHFYDCAGKGLIACEFNLYSFLFYRRAKLAWRFLLEVIIADCVFQCFHRFDKGECLKWLQKRKQVLVRASQK